MQVAVLINSSAGSVMQGDSKLSPEQMEAIFRQAGLHPTVHYVSPPDLLPEVRQAIAEGPDAIVVGGGDGTLSSAAGTLVAADWRRPFGVLPLGTLNHFSKDLQIPGDLAGAVNIIAAGNVRTVDVAEVNGRIFLNNCSVGAYPEAVRRRDRLREHRGHGKWRAMTIACFEVMRDLKHLPISLEVNTRRHSRKTPLVLVSNNRYGGHLFSKNLRERLDAGEIWVYTTRLYRIFPLLRLGLMALVGRLDEAEGFESWPAQQAVLSLPGKTVKAATDGEVGEYELPLRFRIRPRALRVFAPPLLSK